MNSRFRGNDNFATRQLRMRSFAIKIAILLSIVIAIGSCRTVIPARQVHPSSAPDISRVTLKNGTIVTFNDDFGWYNKQAGIIEGVTSDSQHVEYHLSELLKVETVREYAVIPAVAVALIPLGIAI